MESADGHGVSIELRGLGGEKRVVRERCFNINERNEKYIGDEREDVPLVFSSVGRGDEEEAEDDSMLEFEGLQLAEPGPLRRAAAYVLKRPHIVGLAILLGSFLLPLFYSGLFGGRKPLICEEMEITGLEDHLEDLTLEEKIGQMVVADLHDVGNGDMVTSHFVGAVLVNSDVQHSPRNGPSDWLTTALHLQAKAQATRKRIPTFFGTDSLHGHARVYGATVFPQAIGLGATFNSTLVQQIGFAEAKEMRATGVNWALGPVLSVCEDVRWGGCYESYSGNEKVVAMMGPRIDGLGGYDEMAAGWNITETILPRVAATGVGFLGNGGTAEGITGGMTTESDSDLRSHYLRPFVDAVARGVPFIQLARGHVNGEPIHNSSYLFQILKEQLNFPGIVLSGRGGLADIPGDWATQVRTVVNRGVDMVMPGPGKVKKFIRTLMREVAAGGVDEARIDDAVLRILRIKKDIGLLKSPCGTDHMPISIVGSVEHRETARSAVRQSLVLLKNGGGKKAAILPLPFDKVTVLATGSHIHDVGLQCGGHTITLQGSKGSITKGTTILEGIQASLGGRSRLVYKKDPDDDFFADYAIIAVGEEPYAGVAGDRGSTKDALELSTRSLKLIAVVCIRVPCLVILVAGRPLVIEPVLPVVNALVVAWLPGSEGEGIADVIFQGRPHDFVGSLPVPWLSRVDQHPTADGKENRTPLFPQGFGLTLSGTVINHTDPLRT